MQVTPKRVNSLLLSIQVIKGSIVTGRVNGIDLSIYFYKSMTVNLFLHCFCLHDTHPIR